MKENDETKRAVNVKTADEKQAEERAARKRLTEMGLLDDFLFGTIVTYPGIGEQFVRILLKIIFGREFKHLSVTAQKVFYGTDTNLHGARLDVYLEPEIEENSEGRATVYDMEPDRRSSAENKRALPRRMRFYHAKITARSLRAGAETVFLYTGGTQGEPNEGLGQLLHYLENTTYENAVNENLHEIHRMVEAVKNDPEVIAKHMIGYLKRQEEINRIRKEFDQIREESDRVREESDRIREEFDRIKEESDRTNERCREEGRASGDIHRLTVQICKKMKMGQSLKKIAEDLVEEIAIIEPIYNIAEKFAPEYNPDQVFEQVNAVIKK